MTCTNRDGRAFTSPTFLAPGAPHGIIRSVDADAPRTSFRNTGIGVISPPDQPQVRLSDFAEIRNCLVEGAFAVDRYSVVAHCALGNLSTIGTQSFANRTNIERYVSIGSRCSIGADQHELDALTTSQYINNPDRLMSMGSGHRNVGASDRDSLFTSISHDCWIGDNSVIRAGVCLAVGSVVGAGSVVTHDTEPFEIVVGNPARRLRFRFDEPTRDRVIRSQWWDISPEFLATLRGAPLLECLDRIERHHGI